MDFSSSHTSLTDIISVIDDLLKYRYFNMQICFTKVCITKRIMPQTPPWHSIQYWSPSRNKSFHGSYLPAHSPMAETICRQKSGTIFTHDDLKVAYGLVVLESGILDVDVIRIDNTGSNSFNMLIFQFVIEKQTYVTVYSLDYYTVTCYKSI